MIVSSSGEVIAEALGSEVVTLRASIDIDDVSNWYLDQQREDVVQITYRD
jgi:hypothetical protein